MNTSSGKRIGVYIGHTVAYFIEISYDASVVEKLFELQASYLTRKELQPLFYLKHEDNLSDYFDEIMLKLLAYDDIYIFGASDLRYKLYEKLKAHIDFGHKSIAVSRWEP